MTVHAQGAAAMSESVLSARPVGRYATPPGPSPGVLGERPVTPLEIGTHRTGDRTTVVAVGEIDMDTCPILRRSLYEALSASVRGIELDLAGVRFCDCSGLNVLMLAGRNAAAEGRTVVVRSASPAVERLLTATGTSSLFAFGGHA